MEKKYPSDELVNTLFNLFIKEGYPKHYDFPEYMDFIDSAVTFKDMPEYYDIYDKCRLFSRVSEEQREYVLTKNEEYIKALIKKHTIDEDIFNFGYFNCTNEFNEFFLNKKISNEEKKELINLHSINTMTPIDSTIKSVKELSEKEIFDWLDLSPMEQIYKYVDKWKNNKYLTSVLEKYNKEIFDLAKSCNYFEEFTGLLFIKYNHISAYFDYPTGKFEILTCGIKFYDKLKESEFWYEYNIPSEKRDFYNRIQELYDGTTKEEALYWHIKERFSKLNTWHDLERVSSQIEEDLQREKYYDIIMKDALGIGIGIKSEKVIDEINIYEATKLAMYEAIDNCKKNCKIEHILIDAMKLDIDIPNTS